MMPSYDVIRAFLLPSTKGLNVSCICCIYAVKFPCYGNCHYSCITHVECIFGSFLLDCVGSQPAMYMWVSDWVGLINYLSVENCNLLNHTLQLCWYLIQPMHVIAYTTVCVYIHVEWTLYNYSFIHSFIPQWMFLQYWRSSLSTVCNKRHKNMLYSDK